MKLTRYFKTTFAALFACAMSLCSPALASNAVSFEDQQMVIMSDIGLHYYIRTLDDVPVTAERHCNMSHWRFDKTTEQMLNWTVKDTLKRANTHTLSRHGRTLQTMPQTA